MKLITLISHNFNQINHPMRGARIFDQNWEMSFMVKVSMIKNLEKKKYHITFNTVYEMLETEALTCLPPGTHC